MKKYIQMMFELAALIGLFIAVIGLLVHFLYAVSI